EELFGARQRTLVRTILGGVPGLAVGPDFDEFVDGAHGWGVSGRRKFGSDPKRIDWRARRNDVRDLRFVQIAARHNFCVAESGIVEDAADLTRQRRQLSAVEANAP